MRNYIQTNKTQRTMKNKLIIVIVVRNNRDSWYYNNDKNRFDAVDEYSMSENPGDYSVTNDGAMLELCNTDFDVMPHVEYRIYNIETYKFID